MPNIKSTIGCENMSENIRTTVEELHKLINVDNVIGSPIETEDKIIIPVMRMGVGFGVGEHLIGNEGNAAGAGAGVEPICMVVIPKKGTSADGIRVLGLSKGNDTNKALTDLGLMISDLIKSYMNSDTEEYDESEYIEPEFTTKDIEIDDEE